MVYMYKMMSCIMNHDGHNGPNPDPLKTLNRGPILLHCCPISQAMMLTQMGLHIVLLA